MRDEESFGTSNGAVGPFVATASLNATEPRVRAALLENASGLLMEIDVAATFRAKRHRTATTQDPRRLQPAVRL